MAVRRFSNTRSKSQVDFEYVLNSIELITPFGKEALKQSKVFFPGQEDDLKRELDIVENIMNFIEQQNQKLVDIKFTLMPIKDIRFSVDRSEKDALSTVELFEVKSTLLIFEELGKVLEGMEIPEEFHLESTNEILDILDPRGDRVNTFYLYEEFSAKLKALRDEKKEKETNIRKEKRKIRDAIREEYKIHLTPKFDYTISKGDEEEFEKLKNIKPLVQTEQDLVSITFGIGDTTEQKLIRKEISKLELEIEVEETEVREKLSRKIWDNSKKIKENLIKIGAFDLTLGKAEFAIVNNCTKPNIVGEHIIEISEGRHLKVEHILKKKEKEYIPISLNLKKGVACITGANMGGKTISLKLVGQIVFLAQYGFFVPAKEVNVGLSSFMQILIGDSQSVERGLSSFGSEMEELKEILDNSRDRALILIDEIASGTNPIEGRALTKGLIEHLKKRKTITLITTHFELGDDEEVKNLQVVGLANTNLLLLEREIRYANRRERIDIIGKYMDYRLKEATENVRVPQDALNIARMLGISKEILESAEKYLKN